MSILRRTRRLHTYAYIIYKLDGSGSRTGYRLRISRKHNVIAFLDEVFSVHDSTTSLMACVWVQNPGIPITFILQVVNGEDRALAQCLQRLHGVGVGALPVCARIL